MMPRDDRNLVHRYEMWDAAYVLGALPAADRREFESHLAECEFCRTEVIELSGIPALLSQLDHDVLASLNTVGGADATSTVGGAGKTSTVGGADTMQEPPPELLPALLATVRRRRRRARLTWIATAAAAAVLAIGAFVGVAGHSIPANIPANPSPQTSAVALPMAQVRTALLSSTVSLSDEGWGTLIKLNCVCLASDNAPHDTLALVVVGRDGSHRQLSSWVAHPGHTATPTGSTSMPVNQIGLIQVVAADSGEVLLQRTL